MIRFLPLFLFLLLAGCSSEPPPEDNPPKTLTPAPAVSPGAIGKKPADRPKGSPPAEPHQLVLEQDFAALKQGEHLSLPSSTGQAYEIEITSRKELGHGIAELTGELAGGGIYQMTATVSKSGVFGRIQTPETTYQITVRDGKTILVDLYAPGNIVVPRSDADMVIPPGKEKSAVAREQPVSASDVPATAAAGPQSDGLTTIDIMILYTPGIKSKYPNDLLENRLNYLVAVANTAYQNSKIKTALRLVHAEQISYPEQNDNSIVLDALTDGTAPFAGVENLRQLHGADLVILLRPFYYPVQVGCGVAWVLGEGGNFSGDAGGGYSVISDGSDNSYYCTDLTMAHEIGHNLGSVHDRAHSSFAGSYPYSYGYGIDGSFGTIMSYLGPEVDLYSNPNLSCGLQQVPCGIGEGQAYAAYNTLSINNNSAAVAAFMQRHYSADVNGDGLLDLRDTILALRISTGQIPAQALNIHEDINGDGQIGMEEAIYSLRQQAR